MEIRVNNENMEENEEQWVLEEEDYFKLKLDNLNQIKTKLNSIIRLKSKKVKRLDKEMKNGLIQQENFLSENCYPFLNLGKSEVIEDNIEISS